VRIAFHLGPDVRAELDGRTARLAWPGGTGTVDLPAQLSWRAHRGETDPVLGWYSARFGRKVPATTLVGSGTAAPATALVSVLRLD
jgi:hypothetical protein